MPTLSAGVSTEVYVPVSGSMTVTPGAGGRVRVDVSVRQGMAPVDVVSPIHSARTFSVPGGATVFLEAIGAAASYSSVPGDGILALDTGVTVGAASTAEQILWQMQLPAGQLLLPGYMSVAWLVSKSGATDAATAVRLRIGAAGTTADAQIISDNGVVAGTRQRGYEHIGRASTATAYRLRHNGVTGLGQVVSTSSPYPTEVTIPDAAGELWLSLSVQMAGTTDVPSIHDVIVRRIGQ